MLNVEWAGGGFVKRDWRDVSSIRSLQEETLVLVDADADLVPPLRRPAVLLLLLLLRLRLPPLTRHQG